MVTSSDILISGDYDEVVVIYILDGMRNVNKTNHAFLSLTKKVKFYRFLQWIEAQNVFPLWIETSCIRFKRCQVVLFASFVRFGDFNRSFVKISFDNSWHVTVRNTSSQFVFIVIFYSSEIQIKGDYSMDFTGLLQPEQGFYYVVKKKTSQADDHTAWLSSGRCET